MFPLFVLFARGALYSFCALFMVTKLHTFGLECLGCLYTLLLSVSTSTGHYPVTPPILWKFFVPVI